jgi:hypothetical protein
MLCSHPYILAHHFHVALHSNNGFEHACRPRKIPHPTPCTLHPTPYTLHPAPCTLHHPAPCTLHLASCTLQPHTN